MINKGYFCAYVVASIFLSFDVQAQTSDVSSSSSGWNTNTLSTNWNVWKSDCITVDDWTNQRKCNVQLQSKHVNKYDFKEPLNEANQKARLLLHKLAIEYTPETISVIVSREKDENRFDMDDYKRQIPPQDIENGFRVTVSAHGLIMQDLLSKGIHVGKDVYGAVGIRVDQGDPVYSDLCSYAACRFLPSQSESLIKQFYEGESASIRLYEAKSDYESPRSYEEDIEEKIQMSHIDQKIPLSGFKEAYENAFHERGKNN